MSSRAARPPPSISTHHACSSCECDATQQDCGKEQRQAAARAGEHTKAHPDLHYPEGPQSHMEITRGCSNGANFFFTHASLQRDDLPNLSIEPPRMCFFILCTFTSLTGDLLPSFEHVPSACCNVHPYPWRKLAGHIMSVIDPFYHGCRGSVADFQTFEPRSISHACACRSQSSIEPYMALASQITVRWLYVCSTVARFSNKRSRLAAPNTLQRRPSVAIRLPSGRR